MIRNLSVSAVGATAEVRSHSDFSKWYTVVRSFEGEYRCTCPRNFIKRVQCKHIDEVVIEIRSREIIASREPTLFVVHFRTRTAKFEAVTVARSGADAAANIRATYSEAKEITAVIDTGRGTIIR